MNACNPKAADAVFDALRHIYYAEEMGETEPVEIPSHLLTKASLALAAAREPIPPPVNPDATARLVGALRAIVAWNEAGEHCDEGIPDRILNDAHNALHMAQFPVVPVSEGDRDACELIDKAVEIMRIEKKASVSLFQRRLRLGYVQASCLMGTLSKLGLVQRVDVSSSLVFSVNEEKLEAYGKLVPVSEDVETIREALYTDGTALGLALDALDRLAAAAGRHSHR